MKNIPFIPFLMGICSPLPLIVMTFFIIIYPSSISIQTLMIAFIGYAAIILSFVGGINWILAMQKPVVLLQDEDNQIDKQRLWLAIIPCILGEGAIILVSCLYSLTALFILAIGFLVTLSYERKCYLSSELPGGYLIFRWIITCLIEVCLISVFFARLI